MFKDKIVENHEDMSTVGAPRQKARTKTNITKHEEQQNAPI